MKKKLFVGLLGILIILSTLIGYYYSIPEGTQTPNIPAEVVDETPDFSVSNDSINYYRFNDKDLNLIVFSKPFEISFIPKSPGSLEDQVKRNNFKFGINGTYFRGIYNDAEHAGLLQIKGELIEPKGTDAQLTHFVIYDTEKNTLMFEPMELYKKDRFNDKKYTLFQTGPLIMQSNVIATDYINSSLNGKGGYLRTALGYTDNGEIFFLIATTRYKLEDLGNTVKGLEIFKDRKVSLINLDGGPSSAIYSTEYPALNFNENKGLPIILGVK